MSEQTPETDAANEPVDVEDEEITDTGVLHEDKPVRGVHASRTKEGKQ